jgi:hypothetical protein
MVEVFPANLPIFLNEKDPNEHSSRNWKNCKLHHGEKKARDFLHYSRSIGKIGSRVWVKKQRTAHLW